MQIKDMGPVYLETDLSGIPVEPWSTIDLDVSPEIIPMGTHWLWHVLGALSAHLVLAYIYHDHEANPQSLVLKKS